jgi:hypothetical protein
MKTKFNFDKYACGNDGLQSSLNDLFEEHSDFARFEEETLELANSTIDFLASKSILIYGAGNAGEHFLSVLRNLGITPVCFLDKNAENIKQVNEIPVCHPDEMESLVDKDGIVIVAVNGIQVAIEIINFLNSKNFAIPIVNGRHLIRILNYPVCIKMHHERQMFDIGKCMSCGVDVKKCSLFTEFLKGESNFDVSNIKGSRKFDWCGIILGQVCTLKCECCCESIPYLKNGRFVNAMDVISDIDKLANACEYLERLEFIGGEPFLHPELAQIIESSLLMKKVGYIYIFTNGTVLPDDKLCTIINNPRVIVHISNYVSQWSAKQVNKLEALKNKLSRYDVKYFIVKNTDWLDISRFDDNGFPDETLKKVFSKCFINYCHRLYNGILYRCPHQYAGTQLGKLNLIDGQHVDIRSLESTSLAKALEDFEKIKVLDSCRHCSMAVGPKNVSAGRQVSSPSIGE